MAKDARIPVRLSSEQKAAFEAGAHADEVNLSTWLRWLGEKRLEEQQGGGVPRSRAAIVEDMRQDAETGNGAGPHTAFIPGYGLNEEGA